MQITILNDLVIVLALSIAVTLLFNRAKLPTIVALLFTGIVAGPHGLRLIDAVHEVEVLAEIGIIFLLFTIGIHFSIKTLLRMKKAVLLGGMLQVFLTIFVAFGILYPLGRPFSEAMFMGWLLSLSSTAIVLKLLEERAEIDAPHGHNALAFLIFQDIIIFPMILFTPVLAGATQNVGESVAWLVAKVVGILILVLVSAEYVVPRILYEVVKTRSRELFLLTIVVICFAVAGLTSYAGLSLSLGAFLAGLIISESEYSHQALGNVIPFQALFMSLFFVSVGMLLDVTVILDQPALILSLTVGVVLLKTLLATAATFLLGFPLRTCLLVGFSLSQIGEFSFLLSKTGRTHNLLTAETYQIFLAVSIITMAATPFIIAAAPRISDILLKLPMPRRLRSGLAPGLVELQEKSETFHDHIIIVGFGINGRNVARAAKQSGIPYLVLEMNPETVRDERARSESILFGDAAEPAVLEHAGVHQARVLVLAISDAAATRKITETAGRLNPNVHVIARTRFLQEMSALYELGADEVIPEEFETSVEIFTRVLRKYLVPQDEIESFARDIRAEGYEMFRALSPTPVSHSELTLHIPDVEISTFHISQNSPLIGRSLQEVDLRRNYGITVLLIRRNAEMHSHPDAHTRLQPGDLITVLGKPDKIASAGALFKTQDQSYS